MREDRAVNDRLSWRWLFYSESCSSQVIRGASLRSAKYSTCTLALLIILPPRFANSEASLALISPDCNCRNTSLKAELVSVEDWDGDTQDEINVAIFRFSNLLRLASDDD